jgi:hypothetical protein
MQQHELLHSTLLADTTLPALDGLLRESVVAGRGDPLEAFCIVSATIIQLECKSKIVPRLLAPARPAKTFDPWYSEILERLVRRKLISSQRQISWLRVPMEARSHSRRRWHRCGET